jgi:hypothetical protein
MWLNRSRGGRLLAGFVLAGAGVRGVGLKRRSLLLGVLALAGVLAVVSSGFAATPAAVGVSGNRVQALRSAALSGGDNVRVWSVSCATVGTCAAGGSYRDGAGHTQAFVVGETNGSWGKAVEVPGTATLNRGGDAQVYSVSCRTAGNCAAGGYYKDGFGNWQVFVVNETNGSWGKAVEVPGSAALNSGGDALVFEVSCATADTCVAGGYYQDGSLNWQAFVVDETNGSWGSASEVPGSATLNSGGDAGVWTVSCPTAGNCSAGGPYQDGSGHYQAFVVDETGGSWGSAIEVPGSAALNSGGDATVYEVSCATAGNCGAGGYYKDGSGHYQAFVVDETGGSWGSAIEVPGSAALNSGGNAEVQSVSCPTAGNCSAAGYYKDGSGHYQAFVVDETGGSWGSAIEVPGSATLNSGGYAGVNWVSCATAGNCAAGGDYTNGSGHSQAFVVNETSGSWGSASEVPGSATLNSGGKAGVYSVSCPTAGNCAAVGSYRNGFGQQAFGVNETNGTWGKATAVRSTFPCVVPKLIGKTLAAAKQALAAAYCGLGKITKIFANAKAGRVVAQHPRPGTHLTHGAKIALTVSKGKR